MLTQHQVELHSKNLKLEEFLNTKNEDQYIKKAAKEFQSNVQDQLQQIASLMKVRQNCFDNFDKEFPDAKKFDKPSKSISDLK